MKAIENWVVWVSPYSNFIIFRKMTVQQIWVPDVLSVYLPSGFLQILTGDQLLSVSSSSLSMSYILGFYFIVSFSMFSHWQQFYYGSPEEAGQGSDPLPLFLFQLSDCFRPGRKQRSKGGQGCESRNDSHHINILKPTCIQGARCILLVYSFPCEAVIAVPYYNLRRQGC